MLARERIRASCWCVTAGGPRNACRREARRHDRVGRRRAGAEIDVQRSRSGVVEVQKWWFKLTSSRSTLLPCSIQRHPMPPFWHPRPQLFGPQPRPCAPDPASSCCFLPPSSRPWYQKLVFGGDGLVKPLSILTSTAPNRQRSATFGSFVLVCGSDSVTGQLTSEISLNR